MRGLGTSTTLDTNHTKKVVVKLMCPLVVLLVAWNRKYKQKLEYLMSSPYFWGILKPDPPTLFHETGADTYKRSRYFGTDAKNILAMLDC